MARIERKLGLVMDEPPVKSTNNSNDIVITGDEEKVMLGTHNFVNESTDEVPEDPKKDGSETPEMRIAFQELQAFSASFDAFAHGGNDVGYVQNLNFRYIKYYPLRRISLYYIIYTA